MELVNIYGLVDPRDNVIKYIGKSKNAEFRLMLHMAKSNLIKNTQKNAWLKKLIKLGLKPELLILDEVLKTEWEFWERYWISQFKAWGFKLKNNTDGGEGNTRPTRTEEFKKRVSEKLKGRKKAYMMTDEIRKKMSLSAKETYKKGRKTHLTPEISKAARDSRKRIVTKFSLNNIELETFNSIKEASNTIPKGSSGNIVTACKNGNKAYGFYWKYTLLDEF